MIKELLFIILIALISPMICISSFGFDSSSNITNLPQNEYYINMDDAMGQFCPTCTDWTNFKQWMIKIENQSNEFSYSFRKTTSDAQSYVIEFNPKSDQGKWQLCYPLSKNHQNVSTNETNQSLTMEVVLLAKGAEGDEWMSLRLGNKSYQIFLSQDWKEYNFEFIENTSAKDLFLCFLADWEHNPFGSTIYLNEIKIIYEQSNSSVNLQSTDSIVKDLNSTSESVESATKTVESAMKTVESAMKAV